MSYPLAALRIPSGWGVMFNILVELPLFHSITKKEVDFYLSADLLWIQQLRLTGGSWSDDPDGYSIDVSWSEPGSLDGAYVLRVARGPSIYDNAILETRDLKVITDGIDAVFEKLHDGSDLPEITAFFDSLL